MIRFLSAVHYELQVAKLRIPSAWGSKAIKSRGKLPLRHSSTTHLDIITKALCNSIRPLATNPLIYMKSNNSQFTIGNSQ